MHLFQRLQDWQDLRDMNDGELADKIGCSRSVISRAKRGLQPLKMEHQLALEEISQIRPAEWAEFYADVVRAQKKSAVAEVA